MRRTEQKQIRVTPATWTRLKLLSVARGTPMGQTLDDLLTFAGTFSPEECGFLAHKTGIPAKELFPDRDVEEPDTEWTAEVDL